jgi:uncharacterized protein YjiS (DUF1127 family)
MFDHSKSMLPSLYEIERRARLERSLAAAAILRSVGAGIAAALRFVGRGCVKLVRDLVAERRMQRNMRELEKLDDRMLADIGLHRGEIGSVVRHGRHAPIPPMTPAHPRRMRHSATTAGKPSARIEAARAKAEAAAC